MSSGVKEPFAELAAECEFRKGVTKFHFDDMIAKRVRIFNCTGKEFTVVRRLLLFNLEYAPPFGVSDPYEMDETLRFQLSHIH